MKGLNKFFALRNFILAFTIFFSSIAAFAGDLDVASAKGISEQTISAITGNLSKKLQTDLADNSVKVKINDIEKQQLSKTVHDFKGTAVAVVENDNNQLPIRFEVKLNPRTQSESAIDC